MAAFAKPALPTSATPSYIPNWGMTPPCRVAHLIPVGLADTHYLRFLAGGRPASDFRRGEDEMNINDLAANLGHACFVFLGFNFVWGLYCVILSWRRTNELRFKNHDDQQAFVDELLPKLKAGQFDDAAQMCEERSLRALPRLALTAIANRRLGYDALREQIGELIQRDMMGPLEQKMSWVATTIKSGPLLGLFGTVLSMMAAFGRIGTGEKIQPHQIAHDISLALICTALGLATAIPFSYLLANLNIRSKNLLEGVSSGMTHVLGCFKPPKKVAKA